jgi:hypothetical protein
MSSARVAARDSGSERYQSDLCIKRRNGTAPRSNGAWTTQSTSTAMTTSLAPFVGASGHPLNAVAVFDRATGYFTAPRERHDAFRREQRYEFNSLGFRGPEYDASAAFRVFVCGCSYTFGMEVSADSSWPVVFTRLAAAGVGTSVEDSNLQNFSQVGASNNYVARTLVKQCHLMSPTLAIAAFTHNSRVEYLDGQKIRNLGFWNIDPSNRFPEPPDAPGARFFRQYSDRDGIKNLLTNMVWFQSAMINRGIPYIMLWVDIDRLHSREVTMDPVLNDFYAVLDQSRVSRLSIKQHPIHVDSVEGHPGGQSHKRFATALAGEFADRLLIVRPRDPRARVATTAIPREYRTNKSSAARLARKTIRAVTRHRPQTARLVFPDTLAVEHLTAERAVEIDLERRMWTLRGIRLRAAFADYVTTDLLRFNLWLSMLTAQEYLRSLRIEPSISAPDHWFLKKGQGSPVLDELIDLIDHQAIHARPSRATAMCPDAFSIRVAQAKCRLTTSRVDVFLRRVARAPEPVRREDPNIYPFW